MNPDDIMRCPRCGYYASKKVIEQEATDFTCLGCDECKHSEYITAAEYHKRRMAVAMAKKKAKGLIKS